MNGTTNNSHSLETQEEQDDYDYENFDIFSVYNTLFLYVSPVLIVVGVVGNISTLIVIQSRYYRNNPSNFILSALAVVDTLVLLTGLLRHWVTALTSGEIDVRSIHISGCHIHMFLVYYFPQLSSWTLVLMTLERLVSVAAPFKAKEIFSRRRMIYGWVATAVILAGINSHSFKTIYLQYYENEDVDNGTFIFPLCQRKDEDEGFTSKIWPWLDMALVSLIPFVIILISNIVIITMVTRSMKMRETKMQVKSDAESRSITAMMVSISFVFLLTTTPVSVYFIGNPDWPRETYRDYRDVFTAYAVCNLLYYVSNSTNFLMYCLTGTRFRRALVAVVFCKKPRSLDGTSETAMSNISRSTNAIDTSMTGVRETTGRPGNEPVSASKVNIKTIS